MDRRVMTTFDEAASVPPHLTPMQRLILTELDRGLRLKEIAEELQLSICTVRMHIRHANSRLQVSSYMAAVREARLAGLLKGRSAAEEIRQS